MKCINKNNWCAWLLVLLAISFFTANSLSYASEYEYRQPRIVNTNYGDAVKAAVEACASGGHKFINSTSIQVSVSSCFKNGYGSGSLGASTLINGALVSGFYTPSSTGDMVGVNVKWTLKK